MSVQAVKLSKSEQELKEYSEAVSGGKKGRPSKFREKYVSQAEVFAEAGKYTHQAMGRMFGVSKSCIGVWKKDHEEFANAIEKGKDRCDCDKVKRSLFMNAIGGKKKKITRERNADGDLVVVKEVSETMLGDLASQKFFLCNRDPERWRDRQDVNLQGKFGGTFIVSTGVDRGPTADE